MTILNSDPLHVRDTEGDFCPDGALEDREILELIEENELIHEDHLSQVGVSADEFNQALNANPEGFVEWVGISSAIRH